MARTRAVRRRIPKPPEGWWEQVPVLNEIYKLLSSNEPVNWELARQVGIALASRGRTGAGSADSAKPSSTRSHAPRPWRPRTSPACRGQRRGCARGHARAMGRSEHRVVQLRDEPARREDGRRRTAAASLPPGADELGGAGQVLQQITGVFMGLQTGFVLGYMGKSVIGQYELPLPAPQPTRLLYVVSNLARDGTRLGSSTRSSSGTGSRCTRSPTTSSSASHGCRATSARRSRR